MSTVLDNQETEIHHLTSTEAQEYFAAQVKARLGMTVEEFQSKLDSGFFKNQDDPKIIILLALLPLLDAPAQEGE